MPVKRVLRAIALFVLAVVVVAFISWMVRLAVESELSTAARAASAGSAAPVRSDSTVTILFGDQVSCHNAPQCTTNSQDCHPTSDNVEFFDDEPQLYIDPEECIDCNVCEPECPVEAIYDDGSVPEEWEHFLEINAEFFAV